MPPLRFASRCLLTVLIALAATVALAGSARPASHPFSTVTATIGLSNPTYNHVATGACTAGPAATHYVAIHFTVDDTLQSQLTLTVTPVGFTAFVTLYQAPFLDAVPTANCWAGGVRGSGPGQPVTLQKFIPPQSSMTVVIAGDGPLDVGSVTATLDSWKPLQIDGLTPKDDVPPVIASIPVSWDATDATGAAVPYTTPGATDNADQDVTAVCTPAPGSWFPMGSTTVTCSAADDWGNSTSSSFQVTVSDYTPPTLTVPADMRVEATGPGGTKVAYPAPTATDTVDPSVGVSCQPASGSSLPLGTTTVQCTAQDDAGNVTTKSFQIDVVDTTPPVLTLPADITVPAADAQGAVVTFAATAQDAVNGSVPVTCVAPSGSVFPVGTSTVHCSASDPQTAGAAGASARGSFTVTVLAKPAGHGTTPAAAPHRAHRALRATSVRVRSTALAETGTDLSTLLLLAAGCAAGAGVLLWAGRRPRRAD